MEIQQNLWLLVKESHRNHVCQQTLLLRECSDRERIILWEEDWRWGRDSYCFLLAPLLEKVALFLFETV